MGSGTLLFHCILLPKASQGAGKRLPVLDGGAVKTTDTRNGRNWGHFFSQFGRDQCLILSWPGALKHFLGKLYHVSFLVVLWAPAQSAKGREDEVKVGHGRWLCWPLRHFLSLCVWNSRIPALERISEVAHSLPRPLLHQELDRPVQPAKGLLSAWLLPLWQMASLL